MMIMRKIFKITTDEYRLTPIVIGFNFVFDVTRSIVVKFLFITLIAFSGLIASDRDEMDQLLQKEMGQDPSKQTIEDNSKKPLEKKGDLINPVEERYKREDDSSSNLLWTLVKVIFVFGILTATMYYVLRFISKNRQNMYPVKDAMRVLASLPLAPNKQIQIVDVSGMLLILGVSDGSVNLIKEIESKEIKEKIYHSRETHQPQSENFLEVFMGTFKNLDLRGTRSAEVQKDMESSEEEIMDEIKFRQLERLEKLKQERTDLSGRKGNKSNDTFS
jgi:flagellar protein FliO/FliZ